MPSKVTKGFMAPKFEPTIVIWFGVVEYVTVADVIVGVDGGGFCGFCAMAGTAIAIARAAQQSTRVCKRDPV
jgi:hypothetical protein